MIRIERKDAGWAMAAAIAAASFRAPALAQDETTLRVMGMPLATGKEQPFFDNFAKQTGLPIEMDYKPLDSTGVKEFEQLRVPKSGLSDIVGLRLGQVSRDEPTILGLDLIASLDNLKSKKVRILDGVMAEFMEKIGATPVTMAFGELSRGLKLGTIDCAVTGPSSANCAGWPESATHMYPLGLQVAVQGYGITMNA